MYKLAIMGSGKGSNFEAIVKWFKGKSTCKDIEITCLSAVEDAPILKKAERLEIKHQFLPFEKNFEYFSENHFDLVALAGYMQIFPENVLDIMGNVINVHPSLLPSFKGKDAIQKAFLAGVKVSGITIHWVEKDIDGGKIITQYPVFITNGMHFDEFEEEIHTIEHKLYPIVIEKVLEDKVFDFQDLMKSSCNNKKCSSTGGDNSSDSSSGGCKGCHQG